MEGFGELRLQVAHQLILYAALCGGVLNYLPTRQAPAALLAGVACYFGSPWALLVAVWLAWLVDSADDPWRRLRDRYGAFWAARVREQFNTAAANAGMAARMEWTGLVPPGEGQELLRALLKRFGPQSSTG